MVALAEGQMEFLHDFRPEFAKHIKTHVRANADADSLRRRTHSSPVSGMVGIGQRDGRNRAKPFGKVEHVVVGIAAGDEHVRDRMDETLACRAFQTAVIARVLPEQNGEQKGMKEIAGRGVCQSGGIAFAIACHALAESGIVIFCLGYPCIESGANEGHRLEVVLNEKIELLGGIKLTQFFTRMVIGHVNSLDLQLARKIGYGLAEWAIVIVR